MNKTLSAAALLAAVALAGCETILPDDRHPLIDKEWRLTEIQRPSQPPVSVPANRQGQHTMRLAPDGTASFQLDCNRGNGSWQAQRPVAGNGPISIGEIASTRMLCPSPSYGEDMAASLPLASAYAITPDGRRLEIRARTGTYVFRAW